MGAIAYEETTTFHSHPGAWNGKRWDHHSQYSALLSTVAGDTHGLTKYYPAAEKDSDSSSDDASSTADSNYDNSSVVSSQSSCTSAGSEISDDDFDGRDASFNKSSQNISATRLSDGIQPEEQAVLLTGLESRNTADLRPPEYPSLPHNSKQAIPRSYPAPGETGKCNRRRSGTRETINRPPCRLKRDTESADCFVMLLITFAARLITAVWPLSASPPMMSSCFNGAGVLPLEVFIHETLRRSKTSYSTLQVALFYIILLKDKLSDLDFTKEQPKPDEPQQSAPPKCRAMQCGRRMFLAALMLASKYLQDRNYSTRAWSKISGLRIPEINENETEYLRCIDYRLHMKKDAFENWSKIVLTLSKLSKLRPGCDSSIGSLRRLGPEADTILAAMVPGARYPIEAGDHAAYSNSWWSQLLQRLDPELVNNRDETMSFLRDNLPMDDDIAELLERQENSMPTPPISPEASPPHVPDLTFNEVLPSRHSGTPRIPTPTEMRAPSPAQTSTLPMRPHPQNLPTPQSTPRSTDSWLAISHSKNQTLRCSASVDALRAGRKQCFLNANLERCPPPRPQSFNIPPVRSLARPAESTQTCYSGTVTPAGLSPANSVLTESTSGTSRSRSSSISSNSSWSSWAAEPPRNLQTQFQSPTPSPLSRVMSMPEAPVNRFNSGNTPVQHLRKKPNFSLNQTPLSQNLTSGVANFQDEGYGSGEDPLAKAGALSFQSGSEAEAIQALMTMQTVASQESYLRYSSIQSTPTQRGHKRTISKIHDPLQDHVSELLQYQSIEDEVMDDLTPKATPTPRPTQANSNKKWQKPNKAWATPKRPAPNSMDTKRMALYCATQQSSAPALASQYLKDQMITA